MCVSLLPLQATLNWLRHGIPDARSPAHVALLLGFQCPAALLQLHHLCCMRGAVISDTHNTPKMGIHVGIHVPFALHRQLSCWRGNAACASTSGDGGATSTQQEAPICQKSSLC